MSNREVSTLSVKSQLRSIAASACLHVFTIGNGTDDEKGDEVDWTSSPA
ncbi:MAG: hypothetical protein ACP5O1_07815 [Phycisphaerae bacterium]